MKKVILDQICKIKGRIGFRGYAKKDIVERGQGAISLSPSNIKNNKLDFSKNTYISWEKYNESPEIMVYPGDIIFCKTASIGKTALIENLPEKATLNPQLVVLKDIKCSSKFLSYYLGSNFFKQQVKRISAGSSIPTLTQKNLGNLEIFLPTEEKQKKIVSKLDSVQKLANKYEEVVLKIETLLKSYFQNTFDFNKNKNVKVKNLFKINENKIKLSVDDAKMVSFVPMASVSEKSKSITEKKLRKFSEVKKGYTPIKRNDLIVAKITPCYENGKMAIADEIEGDIAFGSTEFHTFRSSDKRMITFLYNYLMEDQIVNLGISNMKGSSGHRRVPADFFKNLTIPNPTSSQLEKFFIFVEKINAIKTKYNAAIKIIKNLKLSVLNESFNSSL